MEPLTPWDVKGWDLGAISAVFETASSRAGSLQRLGESLERVHSVLVDWRGDAGEAFRADLGKVRCDIEADGAESGRVAAAVSRAEADVRGCKAELADVERAAEANGWTITRDWRIEVGESWIGRDALGFAAAQQVVQDDLNAVKAHAHSADHELAAAVRAAVGDVELDIAGGAPGGAPPPQGLPNHAGGAADRGSAPPSLQDLLFPAGRGESFGGGDGEPVAGSLPDLLSRCRPPGVPAGRVAALSPAEVESFKALARQVMVNDGVAPDQVEARVDAMVARTQKWLADGMPSYVAPEPQRQPPPGFAEGFGDRWRATEQGIKNLIGQGGPGAPGVLESWEQMLKGTTEIARNPVGAAIGEVNDALNSPSPAYYLGAKASDAATTLPGLMFGGGEGAAAVRAGELADLDAAAGLPHELPGGHPPLSPVDHGPLGTLDHAPIHVPLPDAQPAPVGLDHAVTYHPQAPQAGLDLNDAFTHGQPTSALTHQVADMSTHIVGDNPERVVLGKFDGHENGYIGEARAHGGIYYDTGTHVWDAVTSGLSDSQARSLAWQVNEQFLRTQMENGVGRIEYALDGEYSSLEEVVLKRQGSFSAQEIEFLTENAQHYGYRRVGNAWVKDR